ncbi:MAG: hypothetical protein DME65_13155 [Verrucomicrobia bacterium]|nr:MAG: hypothetical protein DME65_13155 [Verrucomicrobiota bacterium]
MVFRVRRRVGSQRAKSIAKVSRTFAERRFRGTFFLPSTIRDRSRRSLRDFAAVSSHILYRFFGMPKNDPMMMHAAALIWSVGAVWFRLKFIVVLC